MEDEKCNDIFYFTLELLFKQFTYTCQVYKNNLYTNSQVIHMIWR